ncbi:MAG: SdiA-regulated domain-containing protein [bacterium]
MANKHLYFALILILFISCKRDEPNSTIVAPPNTNTLNPIETFDLSSQINEPSGVFYNSKRNSLFIVSDSQTEIFEVDLSGNIIGTIITSSTDMEGITFSANCDTFYVVEETKQLVTKYFIDGTKLSSFSVNVAENIKNSLEGITLDNNNHLFVINEKTPELVLEFVNNVEVNRKVIGYTSDISDICFDNVLNCFWIVSDESAKLIKISKEGTLLGEWTLPFNKAEGITFVNNKMYIVNDSNGYMYQFNKP